jgi:hypothetical protein
MWMLERKARVRADVGQHHEELIEELEAQVGFLMGGGVRFAVATMDVLGIALIVIGVASVCGGLILWPRSRTGGDDQEADSVRLADLVQRLNESSDEDPLR